MRYFLSLSLLVLAFIANARQITPEEAQAVAQDFFNNSSIEQSRAPRAIRARALNTNQNEENAPYYVFNASDDKGFVIISGDDRAKKILGYSDKGNFDVTNMPPQLSAMLDNFAQSLSELTGSTTDQTWTTPQRAANSDGGVLLETANWGQGYPYNAQCPIIDGVQAPTGCVATAMAIVMKYHNVKVRGRYHHTTLDGKYFYDFDEKVWDLPNIDSENNVDQLANFMYACGVALDMNYGAESSGSYPYYISNSLHNYFRMAPEAQVLYRHNYQSDEWLDIMTQQINNGMPFTFSAAGHCWVIDGYDNTGFYHCNWGWDGVNNGYFNISIYKDDACCINVDIHPDDSDREYSRGYMYNFGGFFPGIQVNVRDIERGQPFNISVESVLFRDAFDGQIGLALVDNEANIKEILCSEFMHAERHIAHISHFSDIIIESEIDNDDRIQLVTKEVGSDNWLPVIGNSSMPSYIPLHGNIINECKLSINVGEDTNFYLNGEYLAPGSYVFEKVSGDILSFSYNYLSDEERLQQSVVVLINGEPKAYNFIFKPYDSLEQSRAYAGGMFCIDNTMRHLNIDVTLYNLIDCKEIVSTYPGSLETLLSTSEAKRLRKLVLKGDINASDLSFVREYCINLESLDISETIIKEAPMPPKLIEIAERYGWEARTTSPGNCLPDFLFTNVAHLTSIKLPYNLTEIGCSSLSDTYISTIEIPGTITSIGLNAMDGCDQLWKVITHNAPINDIAHCGFSQGPSYEFGVLFVPKEFLDMYKEHRIWSLFKQIVPFTQDSDIINLSQIEDCGVKYRVNGLQLSISEITGEAPEVLNIPSIIECNGSSFTVTGIDRQVIQSGNVKELYLNPGIKRMAVGCFMNAYSLKKIVIPEGVIVIPQDAFNSAGSLEEIVLPNSIETIDWQAFFNCNSLKELYIGKNVRRLAPNDGLQWNITTSQSVNGLFSLERYIVDDDNEFFASKDGCLYSKNFDTLFAIPGMAKGNFEIPLTVTSLGSGFAKNCHELKEIILPSGVIVIPDNSFENTQNLESITLNAPHIHFGRSLFACSNIKHVVLNENVKDISVEYEPIADELPADRILTFIVKSEAAFDFNDIIANSHIFVFNSVSPSFSGEDHDILVPGCAKLESISQNVRIHEMWSYNINRDLEVVKIVPLIEGLAIDKVVVNGREFDPTEDGIYRFANMTPSQKKDAVRSATDLDVVVEYTLHNRHAMSTHYDSEFNSTIPNSDITAGIAQIASETDSSMLIYNIQGIKVFQGNSSDMPSLPSGIYLKRTGDKVVKIVI